MPTALRTPGAHVTVAGDDEPRVELLHELPVERAHAVVAHVEFGFARSIPRLGEDLVVGAPDHGAGGVAEGAEPAFVVGEVKGVLRGLLPFLEGFEVVRTRLLQCAPMEHGVHLEVAEHAHAVSGSRRVDAPELAVVVAHDVDAVSAQKIPGDLAATARADAGVAGVTLQDDTLAIEEEVGVVYPELAKAERLHMAVHDTAVHHHVSDEIVHLRLAVLAADAPQDRIGPARHRLHLRLAARRDLRLRHGQRETHAAVFDRIRAYLSRDRVGTFVDEFDLRTEG